MRLSEAIRLGSMMKPQAFFRYLRDGATCAMGAACDAAGILDAFGKASNLAECRAIFAEQGWLWLADEPSTCPECGIHLPWLATAHLNDRHKWTRERIADFVEQIENAQLGVQTSEVPSEAAEPVIVK